MGKTVQASKGCIKQWPQTHNKLIYESVQPEPLQFWRLSKPLHGITCQLGSLESLIQLNGCRLPLDLSRSILMWLLDQLLLLLPLLLEIIVEISWQLILWLSLPSRILFCSRTGLLRRSSLTSSFSCSPLLIGKLWNPLDVLMLVHTLSLDGPLSHHVFESIPTFSPFLSSIRLKSSKDPPR